MQQIVLRALELATQRGVQYADVRLVESRSQDLSTRNGRVSQVADTESAHSLVTGIYQKYLAMFRTASGR